MSGSQVLVIGGGPAGTTAATLLADQGVEVVLFDRAHFPRYHIGESLVPACLPVLELLGLREAVEARGYRRKEGTYFRWGGRVWDYRFGSLSGDYVYAWQVERADFDALLLRNARTRGVRVHEGRRVTEVEFGLTGRPCAVRWEEPGTGRAGRHECDFLIDASGRAGIMANRYQGGRRFHESFRNVAFWSYWRGGRAHPQAPAGATVVSSIDDGWVWVIPLRELHSVGVVMHRDRFQAARRDRDIAALYDAQLAQAELVPQLLRTAVREPEIRLEQDYSYSAHAFSGPGYLLAGDAACFLDPLLSTGVHLAMFSGMLAAACVGSVRRGELAAEVAERFYEESYRRTYLRLLVVVAAVYQQHHPTESYFRQAQQLTVQDAEGARAFDAFLNVVSGVEDLRDLQGQQLTDQLVERLAGLYVDVHETYQDKLAAPRLTAGQRERIRATAQYWQAVVGQHTVGADQPVLGHHVVTQPRLAVVPVVSRPVPRPG